MNVKNYIYILLLSIIGTISCKDYLDVVPDDVATIDDYPNFSIMRSNFILFLIN